MTPEVLVDARSMAPPEPLEKVLQALRTRRPGQRVRLLVPLCPYPLYDLLDQQHQRHTTRELDDGSFEVVID